MLDVLLLGASGSIGSQTLDLLKQDRTNFKLTGFSVGKKIEKIAEILKDFPSVTRVCVQRYEDIEKVSEMFPDLIVLFGDEGLKELTASYENQMVINALVGFCGLIPSITALRNNNILCLANKESLVVGGSLIRNILKEGNGKLFPIDSEHVSIAKMLNKVDVSQVDKILITASGGAFRNKTKEELSNVTAAQALNHPTWVMGPKITIDCATMMNKGFEVIEAKWLYDFPLERTDILMHDESYVHSALLLKDGTYIVDVSKPDMHNPIKWSIYQGQVDYEVEHIKSLDELSKFHFHDFEPGKYPCVGLAIDAFKSGGNAPAILNAANEVAVYAFLEGKIKYLQIEKEVRFAVKNVKYIANPSLRDLLTTDAITRNFVSSHIGRLNK